jgi:hypothetical protein
VQIIIKKQLTFISASYSAISVLSAVRVQIGFVLQNHLLQGTSLFRISGLVLRISGQRLAFGFVFPKPTHSHDTKVADRAERFLPGQLTNPPIH